MYPTARISSSTRTVESAGYVASGVSMTARYGSSLVGAGRRGPCATT